ncbi:hypothetical protein GGI23_004498 [Coemansia sp. RSA 2559]|nr:hypothetical protein GGI23_004498 [Coemansia sp. RSA 2559]
MSETGDGSVNDVEFGVFGDENYDYEDFGDFGDFGEPTSMQSQAPVTETNGVAARSINQQSPDTNTPSLVDSTLEQTAALFDDSLTDEIRNETLEKCIRNVFGQAPDPANEIDREQGKLKDMRLENGLLSPNTANDLVTDILRRTTDRAETEPRLLRNLLLVSAASGNLDPQDIRHLLTPLWKIKALETQQKEQSKETPLFNIDEIQSIAAAQEPSSELLDTTSQPDALNTLKHALLSIDALIATKEQALAKKKDDIVTYNQVIQKLIAQASKLH